MKNRFLIWMVLFAFFAMSIVSAIVIVFMNVQVKSISETFLKQEMTYIDSAIMERQRELLLSARDWSFWNEAYLYMVGDNENFVSTNIDDTMFRTNSINFLAYIAKDGKIKFERGSDYSSNREIAIPQQLRELFKPNIIKMHSSEDGTINGIIRVDSRSLLVAVSPVKSTITSPDSAGWVVFASYIDSEYFGGVDALEQIKFVNITESFVKIATSDEREVAVKTGNCESIIPDLGNGKLVGYFVISDIYNNPVLGAQMDFRNDALQSVEHFRDIIALMMIIATLIIPLIVAAYMNRVLKWYIGE